MWSRKRVLDRHGDEIVYSIEVFSQHFCGWWGLSCLLRVMKFEPRIQEDGIHLASVKQAAHEAQSKICAAQKEIVKQKNVDKTNLLVSIAKEAVLEKGKTIGTGPITVAFGDLRIGAGISNKDDLINVFRDYDRTLWENSLKEWSQSMGYTATFSNYSNPPTITLTRIA